MHEAAVSNMSDAGILLMEPNLHTTQLIEFSFVVEHDLILRRLFFKLVLGLQSLIKIT